MSGRLEAIWIKPARRQPMMEVSAATLIQNRGMAGNANQNGRRQVTIISREAWDETERRLNEPVQPVLRRANLMISGIELAQTRGQLLRVGAALIEIWGETRPCRTMDDQHPGLQEALRPEWAGGVFGIILEGGAIQVGDRIELVPAPATAPYQNWKAKRLLNTPAGQAQLVFDYQPNVIAEADADRPGPEGGAAS